MALESVFDTVSIEKIDSNNKKRITVFSCITALFVACCVVFIVLAVRDILSCTLCWIINSIITVPYIWYVVAFIKLPPQYTLLKRFKEKLRDADKSYFHLEYTAVGESTTVDEIEYTELLFSDRSFLFPSYLLNPLELGKTYSIATVGRVIVEYECDKECEHDG